MVLYYPISIVIIRIQIICCQMQCATESAPEFLLYYINDRSKCNFLLIACSFDISFCILKHSINKTHWRCAICITILGNLNKRLYSFKTSLMSLQNKSEYIVPLVNFLFSIFDHLLSSYFSEETLAANFDFLSIRQLKLKKVMINLVIPDRTSSLMFVLWCA